MGEEVCRYINRKHPPHRATAGTNPVHPRAANPGPKANRPHNHGEGCTWGSSPCPDFLLMGNPLCELQQVGQILHPHLKQAFVELLELIFSFPPFLSSEGVSGLDPEAI